MPYELQTSRSTWELNQALYEHLLERLYICMQDLETWSNYSKRNSIERKAIDGVTIQLVKSVKVIYHL